MSNRNKHTLSAQVREDSALYDSFQEYREKNGFESKSEAVRAALRQGVDTSDDSDADAESEAAAQATLTAVALYAVAELVAFPTAARYTLFGAAAVFAAASVVGYGRAIRDTVGERFSTDSPSEDELEEDGAAVASISPLVRVVGGALMLLALAFTAVSGAI